MNDHSPDTDALSGVDPKALTGYLAQAAIGIQPSPDLTVRLLPGGLSNLTFALWQAGRAWVLRRPPLGHVMPKAHDMAREHRVLSALDASGVPVPRPLLLCEDSSVIGAPFFVMDYVDGIVYSHPSDTRTLRPADAGRLCANLVDTLAALHRVDIADPAVSALGRPAGYLTRQAALWTAQWERTKSRPLPAVAELADWLAAELPAHEQHPASVTHGDYRLDNLIFERESSDVLAVLDWEMATLGDPVCDLALLLTYWTQPGDGLRSKVPVATGVTDGPGFWTRQQVLERYAGHREIEPSHLRACVGLVCLKLAVIMESIHLRALAGRQLGATEGMGNAAPALVELGLQVARSAPADVVTALAG